MPESSADASWTAPVVKRRAQTKGRWVVYSTIPKQMCGAPCEMHIQAEVAKTGNTSSICIIVVVTGVCRSVRVRVGSRGVS